MAKYKVMAGMLFTFEGETTADNPEEAAQKLVDYIQGVYGEDYVEDERGQLEFVKPTTIIVEDEEGKAHDFQFNNSTL